MGADIHGFVECRATFGAVLGSGRGVGEDWAAAIDLGLLYGGRSYDAFGCLFGVRNYAGFRPLAAHRGLPGDVSEQVRAAYESLGRDGHSASWIGWAELERVDWGESAETVDERVHRFAFDAERGWVRTGKALGSRRGRSEGAEWVEGDTLFRVVRLTRRDAVPEGGEWAPVWVAMRALADVHGAENVRLVVWFDN